MANGQKDPYQNGEAMYMGNTYGVGTALEMESASLSPDIPLLTYGQENLKSFRSSFRKTMVFASSSTTEAANFIPVAPISLPEGPWKQIPGGVTAAKGFKAAGMYGGLRAKEEKPDLALVTCDVDALSAGAFTTNVVAAAPVLYCKKVLGVLPTARAVLINAGQANAAALLQLKPDKC